MILRTKSNENEPPRYDWLNDSWVALSLVVALILLLAAYACVLNTTYYRTDSPFFDSASYTNQIAEMEGTVRHQGSLVALRRAVTDTTAPLPFLEVIALTRLGLTGRNPSRCLGVVLQAVWLLVLAVALFFYWVRIRGRNGWASVAFTAPFLMFAAMFDFNGGLSDFRLDLSLYIFVSITLVLYLIAEELDDARVWFLTGLFAGLACLTRGTAPVYLGAMLGPILLIRLWQSRDRKRLFRNFGIMLAPAIVLAGVFLVLDFAYLYYYYVVWNADANAKLPLSESLFHVRQGFLHIGRVLLFALAFFGLATLAENLRAGEGVRFGRAIRAIDWKLLYFGFAPVVFLALRGSGPNPFVSMPAVFGLTMFCLAPFKDPSVVLRTRLSAIALTAIVVACGWNALGAVHRHVPDSHIRIDALKGAIELMRADATSQGVKRVSFLTSHIWNFQTEYLRNVLIYEYRGDVDGGTITTPDGIRWSTPHTRQFSAAVPVEWSRQIEGAGDTAKIETLLRLADADVDYMLFPDDATIGKLEQGMRHCFINLKVRAIEKRFLESGAWTPVGHLLEITKDERVQVYAKRRAP